MAKGRGKSRRHRTGVGPGSPARKGTTRILGGAGPAKGAPGQVASGSGGGFSGIFQPAKGPPIGPVSVQPQTAQPAIKITPTPTPTPTTPDPKEKLEPPTPTPTPEPTTTPDPKEKLGPPTPTPTPEQTPDPKEKLGPPTPTPTQQTITQNLNIDFSKIGQEYIPFDQPQYGPRLENKNSFTVTGDLVKLGQDLFTKFLSLWELDKPIDIERAPIVAAKLAVTAMGAATGIYFLATTTDLLHPLKGTGIVPTAIDIVDKLGAGIITGGVVGALVGVAITIPLKYNYNKAIRPFRPSGSIIDQMLFESNITKDYWKLLYAYQGWPDDLIEAQYKTMFIEPSDRLLISMFEDPEIPVAWIQSMLRQRGYAAGDIAVISQYAKGRALDKTRTTKLGTLFSAYKKGYLTIETLRGHLASSQYRPDQINKHLINAELEADQALRELQLDTFTTMFINGHFSDKDFQAKLNILIKNSRYRETYYSLQVSRRAGKEKADKDAKVAEGGTAISRARFVEGLTNEKQLIDELKLLGKAPDEIAIAITEAKLAKELNEFKEKQKDVKVEKIKQAEGRTGISITRFVQGLIDETKLTSELKLLNKSPDEIAISITEAKLTKELNEFEEKRTQTKAEARRQASGKEAAVVKRYVEGYTNKQIFDAELRSLRKSDEEISLIAIQAELQKDVNYRQDQITILRRAFAVDAITIDEFTQELTPLIPDPTVLNQIVTNEFLKKQPKPKKTTGS